MSLRTSFCDLPQNEQQSNSSGRLKFAIEQWAVAGGQWSVIFCSPTTDHCSLFFSVLDHLIDQSVFLCLDRRQYPVALYVFFHLIERLAAVVRDNAGSKFTHSKDLFGHDPDVRRLAAGTAGRLVDEDASVRQSKSFALRTGA